MPRTVWYIKSRRWEHMIEDAELMEHTLQGFKPPLPPRMAQVDGIQVPV